MCMKIKWDVTYAFFWNGQHVKVIVALHDVHTGVPGIRNAKKV